MWSLSLPILKQKHSRTFVHTWHKTEFHLCKTSVLYHQDQRLQSAKSDWTWSFLKLEQKLTGVRGGEASPIFTPLPTTFFHLQGFFTFKVPLTRAPVPPAHPISTAYVTLACASQHFSSTTTFNWPSTFTGAILPLTPLAPHVSLWHCLSIMHCLGPSRVGWILRKLWTQKISSQKYSWRWCVKSTLPGHALDKAPVCETYDAIDQEMAQNTVYRGGPGLFQGCGC